MSKHDDFYIGYLPEAPSGLARWVRGRVIAVILYALGVGLAFTATQAEPGPSRYEFGVVRPFEGVLRTTPVPHLELERPGETGGVTGQSRYLITVFGKTGADERVAPLAGRRVRVQGSLVHRAGSSMIELADGEEIEDLGAGPAPDPEVSLGTVTLAGEIVDAKCHWGVMKPGDGKIHRGCAVACISGGVPVAFRIRGGDSPMKYVLLADEAGSPVSDAVLDLVAEPVTITGQLMQLGDLHVLRADPATYRRDSK